MAATEALELPPDGSEEESSDRSKRESSDGYERERERELAPHGRRC